MKRRLGFSLLAFMVALAMVATVAVVAIPFVTIADRSDRVMETWSMLETARLALYRSEPIADTIRSFRQRVTVNAGRLSQLTTPITAGNAANAMNSCGNQFLNPQVTNWRTHGPFGKFWIDSAVGMFTPIGTASDRMRRTPAGGGGGSGTLEILFINQADSADVSLMDQMFDDASGRTSGVIRWSTQQTDGILDSVRYFMTIDGTC